MILFSSRSNSHLAVSSSNVLTIELHIIIACVKLRKMNNSCNKQCSSVFNFQIIRTIILTFFFDLKESLPISETIHNQKYLWYYLELLSFCHKFMILFHAWIQKCFAGVGSEGYLSLPWGGVGGPRHIFGTFTM